MLALALLDTTNFNSLHPDVLTSSQSKIYKTEKNKHYDNISKKYKNKPKRKYPMQYFMRKKPQLNVKLLCIIDDRKANCNHESFVFHSLPLKSKRKVLMWLNGAINC